MTHRPVVSAYLTQKSVAPWARPEVKSVAQQLGEVRATNPHLIQRIVVALIVWSCIVGTIQNIAFTKPGNSNNISIGGYSSGSLGNLNNNPLTASPAAVAPVAAASTLPDGPTGQLLPPGTMAPDRTYANNYARGQCTWYVAGRRQIPGNWGNAGSWYYHATASGWSVGTTPAIAAIAWNGPYANGAGSYGHVALVEEVSADGKSVRVSEMNYQGLYVKSGRWVASTQFKYIY